MPSHLQTLTIQLFAQRNTWGKLRDVMLVLDSPVALTWALTHCVNPLSKNVVVAGTCARGPLFIS